MLCRAYREKATTNRCKFDSVSRHFENADVNRLPAVGSIIDFTSHTGGAAIRMEAINAPRLLITCNGSIDSLA
jgi:hypothetical protein